MNRGRPYLVVPKLVPQPTWGGTYIASYKQWMHMPELHNVKIGQSYELYRESSLVLNCIDSTSIDFKPEIDGQEKSPDTISINRIISHDPEGVLGKKFVQRFGKEMTILIKFTQALGNSFQLHRQPNRPCGHWIPKAESWYFFEQGTLTYGIKPGINITDYKSTCIKINTFMKNLSAQVVSGNLSISQAKEKAQIFIKERDPWQFVNVHTVPSGTIVDLSNGGIHHSWEADESLPNGNIVYEVQQNVMDDDCTIRSFDQGKIKEDGTIRTIHIDDYFSSIDTDSTKNSISYAEKKAKGTTLFDTPYYSMDELSVTQTVQFQTKESFVHLFVKEGEISVTADNVTVHVTCGHSIFIPYIAQVYTITPLDKKAVLLSTYTR